MSMFRTLYVADMSVLQYQGVRAAQYNPEVRKEFRDWIVPDDIMEYGKREKREIRRMMWGDIANIA